MSVCIDALTDALLRAVCEKYELGKALQARVLTGGLLHRMFALKTTKGEFAVKVINPTILLRPKARGDLQRGEETAQKAARAGLPAVAAVFCAGKAVVDIEYEGGQASVLVYPFVKGKSCYETLSRAQQKLLMETLCRLHQVLGKTEKTEKNQEAFDFARFAPLYKDPLFLSLLPDILRVQALALLALQGEENVYVFSHGDMDRKNVLWDEGLYLIDWESAAPIPRAQEMQDVALSFSQDEKGRIQTEVYQNLLSFYQALCPLSEKERQNGFYESFLPRLGWLFYNLERAVYEKGEEKAAGERQVTLTLHQLAGILKLEKL